MRIAEFDCVIRNATVVSGFGEEPYRADVAIRGDRIARIGEISSIGGSEIDATGLCLSPGFIDVHTHDDIQVLKDPGMLAKLSQGVTSVIVGNCGISASPVTLDATPPDPMNILGQRFDFAFESTRSYVEAVKNAQPATNVAVLIGHTSLRVTTMDSIDRPASEVELAEMCKILHRSIEQGAIGMSTGLAYASARQSSTEEVLALAKVVGAKNGVYTTHLRDEHDHILDAMDEAFTIGKLADVPVVISHFKCAGVRNWGRSSETVNYLAETSKTQDVACDCYPYTASSSILDIDQVTDDYEIFITWSEPCPEYAQQPISAITKELNESTIETARRLQPAGAVYHNMHEQDVERILAYPDCMIGSDGLPNDEHPHPRLWGTFPRVIGWYGREKRLLKLEEAVRKMTSLPARKFKLTDRGLVAEGMFADLVLFDSDKIIDVATYEEPCRPAIGIHSVWVNGELTYQPDLEISARAGRLLTLPNKDSS